MNANQKIKIFPGILLIILGLIQLYALFYNPINGDEAIIAEHSYRLSEEGNVRSYMFKGMGFDWENRQYHYHKFQVIAGAGIIKLFGLNIQTLRILVFFIVMIFYFAVFRFLEQIKTHQKAFLIFVIIAFSSALLFDDLYIFRPEAFVMSFGFVSFYFITQKGKWRNNVYAGVFAGLAALSHLNGLAFISTGVIILLFNKRYKDIPIFVISALPVFLIYFYDIPNFELLWSQLSSDPNLSRDHFTVLSPLMKILSEHQRLFWNAYTAAFTLFFLASLIISFKNKMVKQISIYLLVLIITLSALTHGPTAKYSVLYYPYMILIITISLLSYKSYSKLRQRILIFFAFLYLSVNLYFIFDNISKNYDGNARAQEIVSHLEVKGVNIMAPEDMYFVTYKDFELIIPMAYKIYAGRVIDTIQNKAGFYDYASRNNCRYILYDAKLSDGAILEIVDFANLEQGEDLNNYHVLVKNEEYAILELITR